MKAAAITCTHLLTYADAAMGDLTDDHLAQAGPGGTKTAGWLIGHLCVTGDFIRRKSGRPPLTPKEWGPRFGPGTTPSRSRQDYPEMEALRTAFRGIYKDLADVAPTLAPELLESPSPYEPARARFATFGEFLAWMMTGHLGYHLGQLHQWRTGAGLAAPSAVRPA